MDRAINRSFIIYLLLDSVLATCCEFGRLVAIVASIDDDNEQNFSHTSDTQSCVDRIIITHMDSSMCRATMCTTMCFDRLSRWWFSFVVVPFLSLSYLMGFFERASLFWRRDYCGCCILGLDCLSFSVKGTCSFTRSTRNEWMPSEQRAKNANVISYDLIERQLETFSVIHWEIYAWWMIICGRYNFED